MTGANIGRVAEASIDDIFLRRTSTRAFTEEDLSDGEIMALFEAAKWAPSSSNLQPWLFLYETRGPGRELFDSILFPPNRVWASKAPLLAYACARTASDNGGGKNRTALFDTGSAWMSLALQAYIQGLSAHAMAGIDLNVAYERLGVSPAEYEIVCAIAVGHKSENLSNLTGESLAREQNPSQRRPLRNTIRKGRL